MKRYKVITLLALILASVVGYFGFRFYKDTYGVLAKDTTYVLIPKGSNLADVIEILDESDLIKNKNLFLFLAKQKKYDENRVIGGRYEIVENSTLNDLIDQLKIGDTCPITVNLKKAQTLDQIAEKISKELELDKEDFLTALNDSAFLAQIEFCPEELLNLFLPQKYELYWEWNGNSVRDRFYESYIEFWNEKRLKAADKLNLSPKEVYTLASIVNKETYLNSEFSTIAGLYYNRLTRDINLQSDPTILYTIKQFEPNRRRKRVLYRDLKLDSPYNTYLYKGLPPGPISVPSAKIIDATLNLEKHNYLFMCAESNLGGSHLFSVTAEDHINNASAYKKTMDSLNIIR